MADDDDYDGPDPGLEDALDDEFDEDDEEEVKPETTGTGTQRSGEGEGDGDGEDAAADEEATGEEAAEPSAEASAPVTKGDEAEEEQADDAGFDDAFDEAFEEDEGMDVDASQPEPAPPAEPEQVEVEEAGPSEAAPVEAAAAAQDQGVARKKRIMDSLTEQQLDRYESYRRSSLARPKVKKMVSSLLGYAVNDKAIIALCGMGKVFVGELVETARVLAAEEGHHGPLLPRHVHWAYQNLNCERKIPRRQPAKRLLK